MTQPKAGTPAPSQPNTPPAAQPASQDAPKPLTQADLEQWAKAFEQRVTGMIGGIKSSLMPKPQDNANPFQSGNAVDDVGQADFRKQMQDEARRAAREEFQEMQLAPKRAAVAKAFGLEPDMLKGMSPDALTKMEQQIAQQGAKPAGGEPAPQAAQPGYDATAGRSTTAGGSPTDKQLEEAASDFTRPVDMNALKDYMARHGVKV